ncbi:ABC transporter substrate-binding protein [Rubeoparvulum massiliense]|uniref:ABC transporter substrate-binding protein n=1 Tax=Rubeoparvulum massiliense TaxID=1631346 RepID=UPI00065DE7F7|nr:ABC transporter substrate-binding protein [Rubeoparvulum massiliense]
MRLRKLTLLVLATLLLLTPLIGCSSKENTTGNTSTPDTAAKKDGEGRTLIIATAFPEAFARDQFVNKFLIKYPDINVEFIDFSDKLMKLQQEMMKVQAGEETSTSTSYYKMYEEALQSDPSPDIILLNGDIIGQLVEKDLLMPLDPLLEQHNFKKERYYPNVLQQLQQMGNGTIYGLVTGFNNQAIFYNKTLFEQTNLEFPQDGMTWNDLQQLAIQMTNTDQEKPVYGFDYGRFIYQDNPFMFLVDYARPYDISFIDPVDQKIVMDTETWKEIWQEVVDMFQTGAIPPLKDANLAEVMANPNSDAMLSPFYKGEVAMTTGYAMEIEMIKMFKQMFPNEMENLEFDIVTYPTHSKFPNVGSAVIFANLYAIPKGANNLDEAWTFLEFITSPEYLQHHKDMLDPLPAFQDQVINNDKIHMDAFYSLDTAPYQKTFDELPTILEIYEVGSTELKKAIKSEISVDEAIANFQSKAQPLLEEGLKKLEEDKKK